MPVFTRSQHNKLGDTSQQETSTHNIQEEGECDSPLFSVSRNPLFSDNNMANRGEDSLLKNTNRNKTPVESDNEQEEELKEAKQNPKFLKILEQIIQRDKEKYFLFLVDQGAKLPKDFDTKKLKATEEEPSLSEFASFKK